MPTATIRGADLFYESTGEGEPLVLVHGGFLDHRMWLFVVPGLAELFRVVTVDMRGHGESTGDLVDEPLQVVDDMVALIEHLELAPAHMAGQSAGGSMLLHLATRRPDLFRSLSVHEPPAFDLVLDDPAYSGVSGAHVSALARFREGDFEGGVAIFLSFVGGDWTVIPEPIQAIFLKNAPNYVADWFGDVSNPLSRVDVDALSRFPHPIQLTKGDRSPPIFQAITAKLATIVPDADVAVIEGGSHAAMMERPAEYVAALADFIRRRESAN